MLIENNGANVVVVIDIGNAVSYQLTITNGCQTIISPSYTVYPSCGAFLMTIPATLLVAGENKVTAIINLSDATTVSRSFAVLKLVKC